MLKTICYYPMLKKIFDAQKTYKEQNLFKILCNINVCCKWLFFLLSFQ